jgi:hypothetical protein
MRMTPRGVTMRFGIAALAVLVLTTLIFLGILLVEGLGARPAPDASPVGAPSGDPTADELFAAVEARLLASPNVTIAYEVASTGAFESALRGDLRIEPDGTVDLAAGGTFGDSAVELRLRSDGRTMEGGNALRGFRGEAAPALRDALVIGMTRMGILHNLARLTAGLPPDRANGGVREWVEVRELRFERSSPPPTGDPVALRFTIHVDGRRATEATLWVDPERRLPVRREQVVEFPGGSMAVTELYEVQ